MRISDAYKNLDKSISTPKYVGVIEVDQLVIAFDVDNTLILHGMVKGNNEPMPNYELIAIYHWLQRQGHHMIIWSGGGQEYAEIWARKLGLEADEILTKTEDSKDSVDIAFDDQDVVLAKVNIKVKKINHHVADRER